MIRKHYLSAIFITILSIFTGKQAVAQVAAYGFSQGDSVYTPLVTPTYALGSSFQNSNRYFVDPAVPLGSTLTTTGPGFPIGFNFFYDGNMYDRLGVNLGGWISLGNSWLSPAVNMGPLNTGFSPLSNATAFNPPNYRARISGLAGTISCAASFCVGNYSNIPIEIQTIGTPGSRICIVQFNNLTHNLLTPDANFNFQIRLYEATSCVEIRYGTMQFATTSYTYQVGLGGLTPGDFNNRTSTTSWIATTAGTANTSTITGNQSVTPPPSGRFFRWCPAAPCNGFVNAGLTDGPDSICFGVPFTLAQLNNTIATGLAYQWQIVPGVGPATNIAGATASTYTVPSQTVTTTYRVRVICLASNDTSYSAPKTVYQKNFLNCYCTTSMATSAQFEEIFNVTLGNMNNSSNCGTSNNMYTDYRGIVPPPNLARGNLYNLGLTLTSCTPNLAARAARVYIDFNRNGLWGDVANELVYNNTFAATVPDPVLVNTNIVVPLTATLGITGMRVIYARGSITSPCATYTNGETEDYYVNIMNLAKPVVTTIDTTVCEFTPVVINATAAAGSTLNWLRPNSSFYSGSSLSLPGAQMSDSGLYKVWASQGSLISDTTYFRLHVTKKPLPPYVPPGGLDICQYSQNTPLEVIGQNILWYTTQVGGVGNPVQPVIPTTTPAVHSYYVTQTVNGCESDRTLVLIKVNTKPAPPKVISPLIYCQYDAVKPMPIQGQNIKWYTTPSGGVGSIVTPAINTGYIDTFTYYVTQTIGGCESDRIKFEVMIVSKPNGTILATQDWVCQYDTLGFRYFGSAPASATYVWGAAGGIIESGNGTPGPVIIRYNSPGQYTVRLITALGGCASDEATKTITVRPAPTAQIGAKDRACIDEMINVVLLDVTPGSETYAWNFDGGQVHYGSEGGPYGISWNSAGDKVITLIVRNDQCPSLPITDTVKVLNNPNADILQAPTNSCAGLVSKFVAANDPYYGYLWKPTEMFVTNNNHSVYGSLQKPGWVSVEVVTPEGCKSTDSVYVDVYNCCDVYIPSAFTPNGDGINDVFRMKSEGLQTISVFRVVNRYGQIVFETGDQNLGWDGNFAGKAQDIGVYHYFLRYKCGNGQYYEKKGDVTLIR